MTTYYKIVRFNRDKPNRTIATDLTLEQAQAHCQDPRTSDPDGEWFDGYTVQNPTAEELREQAESSARLLEGARAIERLIERGSA